jgi:capsular exopolysaccharide synthesis family protein
MDDRPRYASVRDYLRVVRERRVLILIVTLVFAGAAWANAQSQKTKYQTDAVLQFQDIKVNPGFTGGVVPQDVSPDQRAAINAEAIHRIEVARQAAQLLGRPASSAPALLSDVQTRPEARTDLIVVTAKAPTAVGAAREANAFAQAARAVTTTAVRKQYAEAANAVGREIVSLGKSPVTLFQRTVLQTQQASLQQGAQTTEPVQIARHAGVPRSPISPKPGRDATLGVVVGLTLGLLLAFLRDALDRRFKSAREISEELDLPIIGFVRQQALGRTATAANGRKPLSKADMDSLQIVRTNVDFLDVDHPPKSILVTSAVPKEGKSTVAAALAAAHVAAGETTLLLECDLRFPSLAKRLGLSDKPGLTDFLAGHAQPADVLQEVELGAGAAADGTTRPSGATGRLVCIVAGSPTPYPAELLRSQRFEALLADVHTVYDAIVIDSSPLLPVADTLELLPRVDGVLVCVRASQTTREQGRAVKEALARFSHQSTGVVLTGLRPGKDADAYPTYSYGTGVARD